MSYPSAMTARATHGLDALTEKEKQTLRLIVRGHDAKSVARDLDLSVHTINERLRDARRKLAVSSSREAARLLFAAENKLPRRPPNLRRTLKSGMPSPSHRGIGGVRRSTARGNGRVSPGSLSEVPL